MILLGDKIVPYEDICKVLTIEDISKTKSNSTLLFNYNEELMQFCFTNNLPYIVEIKNITNAIYANALGAKYILCSTLVLAKDIQKLAQNYMFDTKVLKIIDTNNELEEVAKYDIDGVIYKKLLK